MKTGKKNINSKKDGVKLGNRKKHSSKSRKIDSKVSENKVGASISATQNWIVEDDEDETFESSTVVDEYSDDGEDKGSKNGNGHVGSKLGSVNLLDFDDNDIDPTKGILDENFSDEEPENGKNSVELMEATRAIIPTRRNPMKRKEAAKNVEEFGTIKKRINVGEGGINKFLESVKEAGDLKTAEKVVKLQAFTENEKNVKQKRIKTLDAPAERITSEKIKRTLLYDNAKEEVSKWNSVVYHNRTAEQLVFPLSDDNKAFKKPPKNKTSSEFMPVTPLEEEIAKVLYGEDYVKRKKAEMAKDPEKTDVESYLLSVEEAMATHSEMAKLRAMQSYAMAKAKRQNKIKSKKYHRLLRKSKIKNQMKEFEELQKKDPEAAMLKLEELEKARIQERMSLKHRNTSKWAKMQAARAKYDKDSRMALSEQLKISRELTQKVQESSSDEDDEDMELPQLVRSSVENPWMLKPSLQDNEKLQLYYTGYKKFWEDYNRQIQKNQHNSKDCNNVDNTDENKKDDSEDNEAKTHDESNGMSRNIGDVKKFKYKRNTDGDADEFRELHINEEQINSEGVNQDLGDEVVSPSTNQDILNIQSDESKKKSLEVDPDNFLKISKTGSSIAPQFNAQNSQVVDLLEEMAESDDETEQRKLIAEAFEDDDIVSEFHKHKKEIVDASKPQDIDNFLPGWGSWAGKDIVPDKGKRQKFVKKAKKGPPRKDAKITHVIINENVDDKIRAHQVKEVPFPFTRVKDFEKVVRAPIGRTWMPESAVKSLTAPKVITRLGHIIKPISEDVLVKSKDTKFHVPNTINRMATVKSNK